MALIEGFRVQNYRALRDVTLGRLSHQQQGEPMDSRFANTCTATLNEARAACSRTPG